MTNERQETGRPSEGDVLPKKVKDAIDWLGSQVGELMKAEDRQDALFRNILVSSQFGDVSRYITHDQKLNPKARAHGTRQEEIHAYGQLLVQVIGLMWSREIPFKEALALGLRNWQERDWQKVEAKKEASIVKGRVANPGEVTAKAYVVSEKHKLQEFKHGVLVVEFLRPDDMAFLQINRPAAVVSNQGGVASHPAVIAREFGIPAIVGTGNATELIPHGSEVLLKAQGEEGTVIVTTPSKRKPSKR